MAPDWTLRVTGALHMFLSPLGFLKRLHGGAPATRFQVGLSPALYLRCWDSVRHVLVEGHGNYVKGLGIEDASGLFGEGMLSASGSSWAASRRLFHPAIKDGPGSCILLAALISETLEATAARGQDVYPGIVAAVLRGITAAYFKFDLPAARAVELTQALQPIFNLGLRTLIVGRALRKTRLCRARTPDLLPGVLRTFIQDIETHLQSPDHPSPKLGCPHAATALRDNISTLLFAGVETTSSLIFSSLLEAGELDDPAFGTLPYLLECLRLNPPVWILARRCVKPDLLPAGIEVASGTHVFISPYMLHRDEATWTSPREFCPERFGTVSLDEVLRMRNFLPFSIGPRQCIGAESAIHLVVAACRTISQDFAAISKGPSRRLHLGLALRWKRHVTLLKR